jgi:hypothetical protein
MGSKSNSQRSKWQDYSGKNASIAEDNFYYTFKDLFKDTIYNIRPKPKEFSDLYVGMELDKEVLNEIYTPETPITTHGVKPDYAIDNTETEKTMYIEVKRQDGWVEGGKRSDGRGNAHERSCKFFTPGLLEALRVKGNIPNNHLPFWTVFQGNITKDPCRVREVAFWYGIHKGHYFFWRDSSDKTKIYNHFNNYIKSILDEKEKL